MANEPINTCGECEFAARYNLPAMSGVAWYCKRSDLVIPQSTSRDDNSGEWETIFTRVPEDCPRPGKEVHKSEKQRPPKYWARVKFKA